jgi:outer membrane protein OmpA-like peptidoglycan-associated protein
MNPRRVRLALPTTLVSVAVLSGCLTSQAPAAAPAPAPAAAQTSTPAPAATATSARPAPAAATTAPATAPATAQTEFIAPEPIKFEDSVTRAGRKLFRDAQATLGPEPRLMVIDPLIDANTGGQTISTAKMGDDLEALAKKDFRSYAVSPLTRNTLATKPLLLIGTLTPVNIERSIDKQPDAFRVWLTLIDLRSGKVVAKALDRATVDSVNPEPLAFYRDSPTWHKDATIMGYINSCQVNTKIGDPADPEYLARLPAAAVINEAILAYDDGKVPVANRLYKEAQPIADPGDLRVLNGLYITNWQLGKKDEARDAFGKLVSSGLELKRLPMKLLFQPGKSAFITSGDLPAQYSIWIASLAEQAGRTPACVRVVGHTSRTGSASANERLSRQRAEAVQKMLEHDNRALSSKLSAAGVGSKEALVGLGTDDMRDAIDRRVEFRVVDCV